MTRRSSICHPGIVLSPSHVSIPDQGLLGELLIQKGADDTKENVEGLTPYDGIGGGS